MPNCNLLAIGNELLNGEIRDLNLYHLSRRLTRLGFLVSNAVIARDTHESIARSLTFLLTPPPDVVVCCGGLGPTEDDLTLDALARSLGRNLVQNPQAQHMVETQYDYLLAQGYLEQRGPAVARAKMARLPEGAAPLPNPIGTAPGVRLCVERTLIFILPGVPAELDAIFAESVVPELRRIFRPAVWAQRAIRVHVDDEAEVAAPLLKVSHDFPDVYLKSLAQPFPAAGREGLRIVASTYGEDSAAADRVVQNALAELRDILAAAGFRVADDNNEESAE